MAPDKAKTRSSIGATTSTTDATEGPTPHPNLGTIEQPPFYAVEVIATSLGTKGGPTTDNNWQVTKPGGEPIPGLYAVGNVSGCMTDQHLPEATPSAWA